MDAEQAESVRIACLKTEDANAKYERMVEAQVGADGEAGGLAVAANPPSDQEGSQDATDDLSDPEDPAGECAPVAEEGDRHPCRFC